MAHVALKCYSMHYKERYIETQYAESPTGKIFTRTVLHPASHSASPWKEVGGLPADIDFYDTAQQPWILPG